MLEEIIKYLKEHPEGVSSLELAKKFLKFQDTQSTFAHLTINSILGKNKRCFLDDHGNWHVQTTSFQNSPLDQLPLAAVFILGDAEKKSRQVYYIALWKILPEPQYLQGRWTVADDFLQKIEMEGLRSIYDQPFESSDSYDPVSMIVNQLKQFTPVFLSTYQHSLLRSAASASGIDLTDDSIHISELLHCAGIKISDPENLTCCSSTIFGKIPDKPGAFKQGQLFADCIRETIQILKEKGIDSRNDIDLLLREKRSAFISGKEYSYDDLSSLPSNRGVYGFKDKNGKYIYIGKTDNLKRKILGFLRDPHKNPRLLSIIQNSHSLITHQCASELESILYEYRLILKHSPLLNPKTDIENHQFSDLNIEDFIIVMPHTQADSIMTFWFCKNKKIKIKPIDFRLNDKLATELEEFFILRKETTDLMDPMELDLAFSWIKKNQNLVLTIPVAEYSTGAEILKSIKLYWKPDTKQVQKP